MQPIYESSINFDKVKIKTDQKDQALLVHELCHVWQYQHFGPGYIPRSLWELITQRDTYVVHYDAEKSFREYDIEEQCEIVAEYFLTNDIRYETYVEEVRATIGIL